MDWNKIREIRARIDSPNKVLKGTSYDSDVGFLLETAVALNDRITDDRTPTSKQTAEFMGELHSLLTKYGINGMPSG